MSQPIKTVSDHLAVAVVPERLGSGPAPLEVLARSVEIADLAVARPRGTSVQRLALRKIMVG
ncbi:hypothetical protein [Protofrankia symbiont of Coriaria ruscifolia]|uniref:hypothetical protein n=1 Tax=Protofrankia symbiont of Coriaria ruscifolia TaxID=1306542 RepID=UPI001041632E|nr:hypothetical protein [Protofrankia symbiont of Coriaria ruscifolia]